MNKKISKKAKLISLLSLLSAIFVAGCLIKNKTTANTKPNIIVILADDMGFSDIGCYGSEIPTPNIDFLAQGGVRLTQFYNNSRCCPTRASLLTGLFPHQAGIGDMAEDPELPNKHDEGVAGYRGFLTSNTVTMAEVLKPAGYHTYMAGKWHVGMHGKEKWPLQRGFERYYGILCGASSYFHPFAPRGVTTDNGEMQFDFPDDYYTTDAFGDHAVQYIKEQKDDKPFFMYLAFNAPHWPLQARAEDIKLLEGRYEKGWDSIRYERLRKQVAMGLMKPEWALAEREMHNWNQLTAKEQKDVAYRMTVYAAMVYRMDLNIGKVLNELREKGQLDNTLIMFLSDNGACAEPYKELGGGAMSDINDGLKYGPISYGTGWANTSNTPLRKYKNQVYEGGISAPLIAYWPDKIKSEAGKLIKTPHHIIDLMNTVVDAAGATYPSTFRGNTITPTEGISMLPTFISGSSKTHEYLYWEHEGHCAIRYGKWKLTKAAIRFDWELYDLKADRTERHDVAAAHPDIVKTLNDKWQQWANTHQVFPKGKNFKDNVANHPTNYED